MDDNEVINYLQIVEGTGLIEGDTLTVFKSHVGVKLMDVYFVC